MIAYNKTTLGILAIVATLGILTVSTALTLQPAHALSKFFNCTTDIANKKHNLTVEDVNACYNKEFHQMELRGYLIKQEKKRRFSNHLLFYLADAVLDALEPPLLLLLAAASPLTLLLL